MTQLQPNLLFRHLSACLVICTMIAAGSAAAKTRQIAVEPDTTAETAAETKPSEKVEEASDPAPQISAPEQQVATDGEEEEGDGASPAPEAKRPERPVPGPVHVYVHHYPAAYGYGGYRPAYGHGGYGYRPAGYHHCD